MQPDKTICHLQGVGIKMPTQMNVGFVSGEFEVLAVYLEDDLVIVQDSDGERWLVQAPHVVREIQERSNGFVIELLLRTYAKVFESAGGKRSLTLEEIAEFFRTIADDVYGSKEG